MNILIKLTCLIGLVIAPILGDHGAAEIAPVEENTMEVEANEEAPIENAIEVE